MSSPSPQLEVIEYDDWRQSLLARNANAVMETIEAHRQHVDSLETNVKLQNAKIATLEAELRALTHRFNLFFIEAQGTGATTTDDGG